MKYYRTIFLLAALCLMSCAHQGANTLYHQKAGFYSYLVGDIGATEPSLVSNPDVYITPASCQKIITALLAYKQLGPDYRYKTDLYLTADKQEAILHFSGDPFLTSEQLAGLLRYLPKNVKNLTFDMSVFQTPSLSPNIMRDDVGSFYAQPVSGMNLDYNLFSVTVSVVNKSVKIENELGYSINSHIIVNTEPTALRFGWEKGQLTARGHININENIRQFTVSPEEMEPYLRMRVKPLVTLPIHFITVPYTVPSDVTLLASIDSKPLREMIPPALKRSDNMVFDSLYLTMVNQIQPGIEKWEQGDTVIKQLLRQHYGVDAQNALIIDGSGLSRYNRVQPRILYEVLQKSYTIPLFREALATPGETVSTLKKRNLPATVRAKTGSMSGIACICGYNIHPTAPQAFTIVTSGFAPPLSEVYKVQDAFLRKVLY